MRAARPTHRRWGLPTLVALITLPLLVVSATAESPAPTAGFDWFEYRGEDVVFARHEVGAGEYRNPILAGFYPDPSLTRVGDDYYLVTSSFAYFPGIPVFHSRDLVHWSQIGHVIDRPGQLDFDQLGLSRGVFAPAIEHHEGTFYLVNTCVECGGNFVVTATDPAGPWSDPHWLPEVDGIDPSLFFDTDGRTWLLNNGPPEGEPLYEGHRALWIQEFDPEKLSTFGPRTLIVDGGVAPEKKPIWIEGPHVFRRGDTYYLIAAEGGTEDQHSQVVFRSDSPRGPWTPGGSNPILTQRHLDPDRPFPITSAGHADFVETQNGEWWATFLATRPYRGNHYQTGRETFLLPVRWIDGWPVVLTGDATIPWVHPRPSLPVSPAPTVPTTGNFVQRDEFDRDELSPHWVFARIPRDRWWDLGARPGTLTLTARPVPLGDRDHPSLLARRQQHAKATATTALSFVPTRAGDRAGLVTLQNDERFYFLGLVAGAEGAVRLQVDRRRTPEDPPHGQPLVSIPWPDESLPVHLRITVDGDRYGFEYAKKPGEWRTLTVDPDGSFLSTESAGGFVGAMFGLYAYSPETRAAATVP